MGVLDSLFEVLVLVDLQSEPDPLPDGSPLVRSLMVTLRRVGLTGMTLLMRVGLLLRGILNTNGPGWEIGTTIVGATCQVGDFVAKKKRLVPINSNPRN